MGFFLDHFIGIGQGTDIKVSIGGVDQAVINRSDADNSSRRHNTVACHRDSVFHVHNINGGAIITKVFAHSKACLKVCKPRSFNIFFFDKNPV
ncbi:hypothetical protein SDC9_210644 [bioreactor metagenome]|uniref:Uncharacterized protein n=1 Tax=bioreactor metagenome TaxID=1076179 RepID=A0A645JH02_9ZZZZ